MSNVVNLTIKAKFCYFTRTGKYHTVAIGNLRHDWETLSNLPRHRRNQIIQDNKGVMPGGIPGRASEYFILIIAQSKQTLVLPESLEATGEKNE